MKIQGKEVLQPLFVALSSRYWMRCQHVIKPDEDIIVEAHGYDDEGPTIISPDSENLYPEFATR